MGLYEWFESAVEWLRETWERLTSWVTRTLRRIFDRVLDWLADHVDTLLEVRDFVVFVSEKAVRLIDKRKLDATVQQLMVKPVQTDEEIAALVKVSVVKAPAEAEMEIHMTAEERQEMRSKYPKGVIMDMQLPGEEAS